MPKKTCICCGKKIGIMNDSRKLLSDSEDEICTSCFYKNKIGITIGNAFTKLSIDAINNCYEDLIEQINKCQFNEDGFKYLKTYADIKKREQIDVITKTQEKERVNQEQKEKEQKIQESIEEIRRNFLITSGFNFEGYNIKTYLGFMTGSVVKGTGFFSETSAAINDFLGSDSSAFAKKLEIAKESAIDQLRENSILKGANAIIGIDIDYITFSNNMIGVVANGTAVVIEKTT